ncbi:hypothetical protein Tco_0927976, partial [Tanacetum coccineum]
ETVDISEESEPELEPVKKKTDSRRVVKKKFTVFADDNIIPDPDVALELEKTGSRSSRSVVIQDTPSAPKPKPVTSKPKLKGVQSLTPAKKEATDIMQALKESKKTSKRQPDEEKDDKEGDADDEGDDHISDTQDTNDEDYETKHDEDEIYKYKICVQKDEDVEMTNAKVKDFEKGDVAQADVEKTKEIKDAAKKAEHPPTSSSLFVFSGFSDQFLKLSSDMPLIGTIKDTIDVEISSLFDIKIQSEVPHIQSSSVLKVLMFVISEPSVLTPVQETSSAVLVTTLPLLSVSTIPPRGVAKLGKDVFELKNINHFAKALATLKSQVPTLAPESSKIQTSTINLEQESEKSALEILKIKNEQAEKQKLPKYTIKSTNKAALKEYDHKSALYQTMHENKSFNRNLANHILYHALMEALIEDENAVDKGVADIVKDHKRKHDDYDDDDEEPPARPNQGKKTKRRRTKELETSKKPSSTKETPKGKASTKGSKTGKSASIKELVEEPIVELVIDDAGENVNETSVKLYLVNLNSIGSTKWSLLQRIISHSTIPWPLLLTSLSIEDIFPTLLSTIKHAYDKDVAKGIKHYRERRKLWCRSQMKKISKHNVYSTQKILGVKSVSIKKLHGYSHLEEVVVKRADRQLCKFKEGDFVDLHLNDIKEMLLLVVQHKLFHLNKSDIVYFIVALRMFTRSLIIKRQVEDLQLGIESYQKKLNTLHLNKPFLKSNSKNSTLHHINY